MATTFTCDLDSGGGSRCAMMAVMGYELADRLVVGVASSALFDLTESGRVWADEGEDAYRRYQQDRRGVALHPGTAFGFIRRLLSLNDLARPGDPLIEVVVLSSNDADTGLRVMRSIAHHGLPITRAVFCAGRPPYRYMDALNVSLFLSADAKAVAEASESGYPAGQVLHAAVDDDPDDPELRVAFDFDGVLADGSADLLGDTDGLDAFRAHEEAHRAEPHSPGPLQRFAVGLSRIQAVERARHAADPTYRLRLRIALITARDAPAHERAVTSLAHWGIRTDDAFFLGGIDKGTVIDVLSPHIFFDDRAANLASASAFAPSVYVPLATGRGGWEDETAPEPVVHLPRRAM